MKTSATPTVQYSYADGSANTIGMTSMTYPNGRVLSYDYGTAAGINEVISRVQSVKFAAEAFNLVDYQYLGVSGFVNAASSQPGINWSLYGSSNDPVTGDIYSGLDRFGRVDNCLWQKGGTTLAQIQYGYDRASSRMWRDDGVLTGYDELYQYDGLNRLKDQIRGTLNSTQTAITTRTFQQQWGLDATGNWQSFNQDTDGNGTWDLVQSRTANKVNEITAINHTTGAAWVTPGYDKAGNMIGIPNPTQTTTGTYDAWNRLISVADASTSITNDYDARGFRIKRTSGGVVRHYYYTPGWQCVEERTGTLTSPERQFVWGLRYIDDLVIRDRSTANNGSINERRYAMQDGNWNTIAICDITGSVGERYAYAAYGTPVFMTGAGIVQTSSAIGFETLNAGYRWDGATPQMYYVRNRFLLPMIGTWNKRDALGYVDGMGLYVVYAVLTGTDPLGLDRGTVPKPLRWPVLPVDRVANQHGCCYSGKTSIDCSFTIGSVDCALVWVLGERARQAEKVASRELTTDQQDAFRHCYWSCTVALVLGVDQAKKALDLYESCNPHGEGPACKDLWNNAIGRSIANTAQSGGHKDPGITCYTGCKRGAKNGNLQLTETCPPGPENLPQE